MNLYYKLLDKILIRKMDAEQTKQQTEKTAAQIADNNAAYKQYVQEETANPEK